MTRYPRIQYINKRTFVHTNTEIIKKFNLQKSIHANSEVNLEFLCVIDRINEGLQFINKEMNKIVGFYDNCSRNIMESINTERNVEYNTLSTKLDNMFNKLKKQKERVFKVKEKCFLTEREKGNLTKDNKLKKLRTKYENEHVG